MRAYIDSRLTSAMTDDVQSLNYFTCTNLFLPSAAKTIQFAGKPFSF